MTSIITSFPDFTECDLWTFDTETTGLDHRNDKIFGIAYGSDNKGGHYNYVDVRDTPAAKGWLMEQIKYSKGAITNHNMMFDALMLNGDWDFDILTHLVPKMHCTMVRAALINEHLRAYDLDSLLKKYLGMAKYNDIYEELAKLFGGQPTRKAQAPNFKRAPFELMHRYGVDDAKGPIALHRWQDKRINEPDKWGNTLKDVYQLERDVFYFTADTSSRGVPVDADRAEQSIPQLDHKVAQLQSRLNELAGFEVNVNSAPQLRKLFAPKPERVDDEIPQRNTYRTKHGDLVGATGAGAPSFARDTLNKFSCDEASLIGGIRKFTKARDTFIRGHILGHAKDGVIYPHINQTKSDTGDGGVEGVGPGRFSYSKPALQQIPARDKEVASIIRPLFIPDFGQTWGCWDYEQFEFRMFAHYINNRAINDRFADDPTTDFHQFTADLSGLPRNAPPAGGPYAKMLNLGMVFCMGGGTVCDNMGMPYEEKTVRFPGEDYDSVIKVAGSEGEAVIEEYHRNVPGIREMQKAAANRGRSRGYVMTLGKRHIRFPKRGTERKASGLLYQGSSADCMKRKLYEVWSFLRGTEGRILLSVHDEVNTSLPVASNGKACQKLVKGVTEILEDYGDDSYIKLRIPILTDFGEGINWAIASGKG